MEEIRDRYDNDVFISYNTRQKNAAYLVRDVLTQNGLRCWMAPESIPAGSNYTVEIPRAIHGCRTFVLIFSADAQRSDWVYSEVNNAIRENKPIIPFMVENCRIGRQYDFILSKSQRITAFRKLSDALEELTEAVSAIAGRTTEPDRAFLRERLKKYRARKLRLAAVAVALALAVFVSAAFLFEKLLGGAFEADSSLSEGSVGECQWSFSEETETLTISGSGSTELPPDAAVPWERFKSRIRFLTVEDGVTDLCYQAMMDCGVLEEINLPDTLTSIGPAAFQSCYLLRDVTIPASTVSIGRSAFSFCKKLGSVAIPAAVAKIGENAFLGSAIDQIEVDAGNTAYTVEDNILYDKNMTALIYCPRGYAGTVVIVPDGVTSVETHAFDGCKNLVSVALPDSVTRIGVSAFAGCHALKDLVLSENLVSIGDSAFALCRSLETVALPESLTSVGEEAFMWCYSLTEVKLPPRLAILEENVFAECTALEKAEIPPHMAQIADNAFENCDALTIIGAEDSAAERFALNHGIPFAAAVE